MIGESLSTRVYRFVFVHACVLCTLILASCNSAQPIPDEPPTVYVDAAIGYQPITLSEGRMYLQAGLPQTVIPESAIEGQFVLGSWRSPTVPRSHYEYARFTYLAEDTCQVLPQGDNLSLGYELFNEAGSIVKQDSIRVNVHTCPPT